MTTQLPNGYEAVKVPEGAGSFFIHLSRSELKFDWGNATLKIPGEYFILGRADELTEEQCREIVETHTIIPVDMDMVQIGDKIYTSWVGMIAFETAKEGLTHLLASLHLEPHTTIILKKENV